MLGETYNTDQMIGKTLFAAKYIVAYNQAGTTATKDIVTTFKRGDRIGPVFSYLIRNGQIYWMIETSPHKFIYIDNKAPYDINSLREQGFKSNNEIAKEKELQAINEKGTIEKITDSVSKTFENTAKIFQNTSALAKYALPAVGLALVIGIGYTAMKKTEQIKKLVP